MYILTPIMAVAPSPRTDRNRLAGVVTVDGVPAQKRIAVIDRLSLATYAVTVSNPTTGVWAIKGLPEFSERSLVVVAFDDAGNFNAEIADYISQVTA